MARDQELSGMGMKEKETNPNIDLLTVMASSPKSFCINSTVPSWLLANIADLEERMKTLAIGTMDDGNSGDTFAERSESYYQKRPQLLELLQDLYNGYVTLSYRYVLTFAKQNQPHHQRHFSQVSTTDHDYSDQEEVSGISQLDSDIESSISYPQQTRFLPTLPDTSELLDGDSIVSEFVIKNVEYDLLRHEVSVMERRCGESSRKIELQQNLLEVLESERLILLNENARLGYRVNALMEENQGLASESLFMKRKAGELAKCILGMREDHRVSMLNKKIEDLQAQIYGLEKRNREYYEQLIMRENHEQKSQYKDNDQNTFEACFSMERLRSRRRGDGTARKKDDNKGSSWWKKMKNMELFSCGINSTCA